MKGFFENYNDFKNNRRAVGFSKLGFWILFFGIIILIANFSSAPTESNNKSKDNKSEINSYHFEYIFNDLKYSGTFLNNDIEIIGDEYSFYIKKDKIYTNNLGGIIPDYTYLNLNKVNEIIKDLEPDSETTYKDGKKESTYIIKEDEYDVSIKYTKDLDNKYLVSIDYLDNHLEISYFDIDDATLVFDDSIYIYDYNGEELNEY